MNDPDRLALLEICDLFYNVRQSLNGNMQILALHHANFQNQNYQDAVIENWPDGNALVPTDWFEDL